MNPAGGDEDCLFLDVYVPGNAIQIPDSNQLPVVIWIHGGAYIFGAKDSVPGLLYSGIGPMQTSGNQFIFVTGNYRLGAFGWLAGTTMENHGLPNAGLHDQRAVFQWVKKYIRLLGGNPNDVSAWGESAGGGSIYHHMVAQGGTLDPLFKKAITQSAAFQPMFDRTGTLEETFTRFAGLAGCDGQGVDCLRAQSMGALANANQQLQSSVPSNKFAVGPASDGTFIRQLARLEYASGNYWEHVESMIVSHVSDESAIFTDTQVLTNQQFTDYIDQLFSPYALAAGVPAAIEKFYQPPALLRSPYQSNFQRLAAFTRDSSFTCNQFSLTNAFLGDTWNLQYGVTPGLHGTDLVPLFFNGFVNSSFPRQGSSFVYPLAPGIESLAKTFQGYFTSHARSGDPNTYPTKSRLLFPAIYWPHPSLGGERFTNVLNAGDAAFSLLSDDQVLNSHCDFQLQVAAAVTNCGGYAVPGTAQSQLINATCQSGASRIYRDACTECRSAADSA